jgi:gliding motility-associated-like protein
VTFDVTSEDCGESNGSASALVSGGVPGYQYSWSNGATTSSISNIVAGVYSVTVKDNNGCSKASGATVGQINNVNASFTASVMAGGAPLNVSFANTSTGAETYSWDFGDGSTSTSANPTHTFTKDGTYEVVLTATHNGTCEDQTEATIIVTKDSIIVNEPVGIPNFIAVNSNIDANRKFKIRGSELEKVSVTIFDRWGINVFSSDAKDNAWDGGNSSEGTYFYVITYNEKGKEPVTVKGFVTLFR